MIITNFQKKNERPSTDQKIPVPFDKIIKRCWDSNPDNRPTAVELHEMIESVNCPLPTKPVPYKIDDGFLSLFNK